MGLIYERSPHLTLSPDPPPSPPLLPPTPPLTDCILSFPQSQDFPGAGGSTPRTTPDWFPHLSYPSYFSLTLSPPLWPSSVKRKGLRGEVQAQPGPRGRARNKIPPIRSQEGPFPFLEKFMLRAWLETIQWTRREQRGSWELSEVGQE